MISIITGKDLLNIDLLLLTFLSTKNIFNVLLTSIECMTLVKYLSFYKNVHSYDKYHDKGNVKYIYSKMYLIYQILNNRKLIDILNKGIFWSICMNNDLFEIKSLYLTGKIKEIFDDLSDDISFMYKRINLFSDIINNCIIMNDESDYDFIPDIPNDLISNIVNRDTLTCRELKKILRKRKLFCLYEHIPKIYKMITGKNKLHFESYELKSINMCLRNNGDRDYRKYDYIPNSQ